MMYDISFVNLGIVIEHLVNHIDVFGYRIAFYGIIISCGMLAGIKMAMMDAKRRGQDPNLYFDFAIYAIVFAIIGARAYYIIFSWDSYKDNLMEIFNLRGGGLAIYGGVIGGILTLIIFAKKRRQSFFAMADTAVLGLLVGQIMGRWGNFFNCEAFGGYTESLFAMRIRKELVSASMISDELLANVITIDGIEYIQVHPTFLYESLWNLGLLICLFFYGRKQKFVGEIFFMYLGGYGLGRMLIESLRTDQLKLPGTNLAVSQLLAGLCFGVSVCIIIYKRVSSKNN